MLSKSAYFRIGTKMKRISVLLRSIGRMPCMLAAFTLLLCIQAVPCQAAADLQQLSQMGPYAIGFTSFVLTDAARPTPASYTGGRPIPVYLWYPVDPETVNASTPRASYPLDMLNMPDLMSSSEEWEAMGYDPAYQEAAPSAKGPFPLVLVSHGWTPPAWMHTGLGTRLASHGFVVAVPYHVGDPQLFVLEPPPPVDHFAWTAWNRPRDLSFVLTSLLQRKLVEGDLLHGLIDPSRIAAAGWSLGGYAAMVLAGGDDTVWDYGLTDAYSEYDGPIPEDVPHTASLPDPRIKAIVTLDGANQELRFEELARVKVPALGLGEEWNSLSDPNMPAWQARAHAAYSSHPNYRVDISRTNHMSFSDFCSGLSVMASKGFEPVWGSVEEVSASFCEGVLPPAEGRTIITRYMLAFLKTQLLGETGYQRMLTPGWALKHESGVEFFETEKRSPESIEEQWPGFFIYFPHQPGSEQFLAEKNAKLAAPR
jgi:predicted dienelactone hydrolase